MWAIHSNIEPHQDHVGCDPSENRVSTVEYFSDRTCFILHHVNSWEDAEMLVAPRTQKSKLGCKTCKYGQSLSSNVSRTQKHLEYEESNVEKKGQLASAALAQDVPASMKASSPSPLPAIHCHHHPTQYGASVELSPTTFNRLPRASVEAWILSSGKPLCRRFVGASLQCGMQSFL